MAKMTMKKPMMKKGMKKAMPTPMAADTDMDGYKKGGMVKGGGKGKAC